MQHRMTDVIISPLSVPQQDTMPVHNQLQTSHTYHIKRMPSQYYPHQYTTKYRRNQQAALTVRAVYLTVLLMVFVLLLLWLLSKNTPDTGVHPVE
jgi:hypothetical protein